MQKVIDHIVGTWKVVSEIHMRTLMQFLLEEVISDAGFLFKSLAAF